MPSLLSNLPFSTTRSQPQPTGRGEHRPIRLGAGVVIALLLFGAIPETHAQNTDPSIVTNDGSMTDEGTDDTILKSELETTDEESPPSGLVYTIDADVTEGQIVNTDTGKQLDSDDTFTQQHINDRFIEYQHDGTEPAPEGFDFTVKDEGGTGNAKSGTFEITINQVNDAPVISGDLEIDVNEGQSVTIAEADLDGEDPDDNPSALTYTVAAEPQNGDVTVNGSVVTTFTEAELDDGTVAYDHDGSESSSDAFDVELTDDDGGGPATATITASITLTNDAPTITTNTPLPLLQGSTVPIPERLLEASDAESSASNLTYTVETDVSNGTLLKNGSSISVGATFTQADLNTGNVEYRHDGTSTRADAFDFTVTDGDGATVTGTFDLVASPPPQGSGTALTLDDNDDYVSTRAGGDDLGLVNESFSIEVWFKANTITNRADDALVGMDGKTTNETLHLVLEPGGDIRFGFFENDLVVSEAVSTGTWYHAAFVYDADASGTNRYIYLNGEQIGSDDASADFQGTANILIGRWRGKNYFDGTIDQVRVWRDALTTSQVRTRARRTIDVEGSTVQDLVAAWRFDAGSGATAYDVIGGRDGTLQDDAGFTSVSGAGVGQASAALQSGSETVGPSGGSVKVDNVSTSGSDALQVYQYGETDGPVIDGTTSGEDFGSTSATKRLNVVWGLEAIGASPSAKVTFDYSQVQGLSEPSNVRLLKRDGPGAPWRNVSDSWTWDTGSQTFSKDGVSSFSQYAIGEASTALPVELARFEATLTDGGDATQSKRAGSEAAVRLTWTTASEQNNAGFEVQRRVAGGSEAQTQAESSTDGWEKAGFVESKAEGGTTTEPTEYRFDDAVAFSADTLKYRLRQVDVDGEASVSEPVVVERRAVGQVRLLGTYPNPARGQATVRFAVPEDVEADAGTLRLYDVLGREVRTVRTTAAGGRHARTLDTEGLSSGVYFLRLQVDGRAKTQRLTVVE